jgi:glycosyltransferase involved in cell wall biosynthesis
MTIYVYPADRTGCGYFRLIWPAMALQTQGVNVKIMDPGSRAFDALVEDDHVVDVRVPTDAEVVVLQRVTHRHIAEAIPVMIASGIKVVVDLDDDLSTIHPRHPAFVTLHPNQKIKFFKNESAKYHDWHNTANAMAWASLVTVSSEALLERYGKHGRGVVIRNYLPQHYFEVEHQDSPLVGWGGSVVSHPDDLDVMGWSIAQLIRRQGAHFKIVGPRWGVASALGLEDHEFNETGAVAMEDWPSALTELGVGVTPLRDNKFNAAKSWLKPLECAGLGIPCVMSPRREYLEIQKLGIGETATKPDQWFKKLKRLVTDDVYRKEMSAKSREVAETMTIADHAWRWAEAWSQTP